VELTQDEKVVLYNTLHQHLQEMVDAREDMIDDRGTFRTFEEFAETIGTADGEFQTLLDIMERIGNDLASAPDGVRGATSSVRSLLSSVPDYARRGYGNARSWWRRRRAG
jgi:hypothetical protein